MPKAKKLPSGNWRVQVYDYKDENGKKHYKSFTATTKREAEFLATQYAMNITEERAEAKKPKVIEFKKAAEDWIDARRNVLSPATTRMYDSMLKNAYESILYKDVSKLTVQDVQKTINDYAATHSPKSVRNAYGLMRSVIASHNTKLIQKFDQINLPASEDRDVVIPEDSHVTPMIQYLRSLEEKDDMLFVVLMAATLGLRRSEICALTQEDFVDGTVRINKALVLSYDNKTYVVKGTKSKAGKRVLKVNPDVFQLVKSLGSDPRTGRIITTTPARVTCRYTTLAKHFGVPGSLHDLRHYYASILAALNTPVKYAMKRLGHSTPQVTEQVYQHTFTSFDEQFDQQIDAHTAQLLS